MADLMNPSPVMKVRHWAHYRWNRSRFNRDYDPFVSSCICCCSKCDRW